jgi:hypothetical protein
MLQYSSFNSSVLLNSQAYITAFDLRQTQSYAISVHGENSTFRSAYGMYFDIQGTDPDEYIFFQDNASNGVQDPARYDTGEGIGTPFKLDARFHLLNICASDSTQRLCYTDDPDTTGEIVNAALHDLAISFVRPNFDAKFYSSALSNIKSVELHIGTNDSSKIKVIKISNTGQISVE